jgi:hypothetical protein
MSNAAQVFDTHIQILPKPSLVFPNKSCQNSQGELPTYTESKSNAAQVFDTHMQILPKPSFLTSTVVVFPNKSSQNSDTTIL